MGDETKEQGVENKKTDDSQCLSETRSVKIQGRKSYSLPNLMVLALLSKRSQQFLFWLTSQLLEIKLFREKTLV